MTGLQLSAEPTHSVWDRSLPLRLHTEPGDEVAFECVDASSGQVYPAMTAARYRIIDRIGVHALSGPVRAQGTGPGDLVQVDVLSTGQAG